MSPLKSCFGQHDCIGRQRLGKPPPYQLPLSTKSEGILCIGKCIHRPPQRPTPPRHSEKILIQGQGVAEEMGHSEI